MTTRVSSARPFAEDDFARAGLLLTLVALCSITWRKWGYLPIDSGREMYVPAAIAAGKRLYFDLQYPYGPLIPYWHAALFRVFGIHLGVLLGAGVSVVTIEALLLYSVSRIFLPAWLSFAAVFAFFLQAFQVDLFNYILPYSYPAVYGSMFSVLMVWVLLRPDQNHWRMIAAGFLAGIMMLTKVEFGVAGYAGVACALVLEGGSIKSVRKFLEGACACIPGAILWISIYGWYIHTSSAGFFLGENLSILPSSHFQQHFAKLWNAKTGLILSPSALALSAFRGFAGFAGLIACLVLAARSRLARWALPAAALILFAIHIAAPGSHLDRLSVKVLHPLFFNSGMIWIGFVVLAMAVKRERERRALILLSVIATTCGFRVITKVTPNGYSMFFDVLVYLVFLVAIHRVSKHLSVDLDGAFGKGLAAILCLSMVSLTSEYYPVNQRPFRVSSERGALYTSPSVGEAVTQALTVIESARQKSQAVVVMPEDTALYFFSGTTAPSRWYIVTPQVLPPGVATAEYIEELDRAKVHYVIVSDRATPEFGLPIFGADYGQQISSWLNTNFHVVQRIGDYQPVAFPSGWGALVYERNSSANE